MSRRPVRGAARLAAILDALPDALLLVDHHGVIVNANARALDQFETEASPLVGLSILDVLPEYTAQPPLGNQAVTKPVRMTACRTDGQAFRAEATTCYLPDGYEDELVVLVVRNVSEVYDVESELVRQQRQTELILRATTEGIIGVDNDCRIVLVNPAAARILRYRAGDLGGKDFRKLLHHSRADGTAIAPSECPVTDTLHTGRKHRVGDEVLWRRDGAPVFVEMSSAPVREGDAYVGAVITFSDQSEVKAVSRRNEELVSILDSELRRPLNSLYREVSELAEDGVGELGPTARRMIRHVLGEFERMTRLVHDVLDYQRYDTGSAPLNRQTVELEKILRLALEATSSLARNAGVDLHSDSIQLQLVVDADRITQALGHLIADAVSSSPAGTTVYVAAERRANVARIEVRGPVSNRSALHLPIARGIIERHGGFVQALELLGNGTTYVVELPLEPTGQALSAQVAKEASAAALPSQANSVLTASARPELTRSVQPNRPPEPARHGAAEPAARHGAADAPPPVPYGGGTPHGPWRPDEEYDAAARAPEADDAAAQGPLSAGKRIRGAHARQAAEAESAAAERGRIPEPRPRTEPIALGPGPSSAAARPVADDVDEAETYRPAAEAEEDDEWQQPTSRRALVPRRRTAEQPRPAKAARHGGAGHPAEAERHDEAAIPPAADRRPGEARVDDPLPTVRRRFGPEPEAEAAAGPADDADDADWPSSQRSYQPRRQRGRPPGQRTAETPQTPAAAEERHGLPELLPAAPPGVTPVTLTTSADAVTRAYQVPPELLTGRSVMTEPTKPVPVPPDLVRGELATQPPPPRGRRGGGHRADEGGRDTGDETPTLPSPPEHESLVPSLPPQQRVPVHDVPAQSPLSGVTGRPLLVWPEPEELTARALVEHGYAPMTVSTRDEVTALAGSGPAALFVDPLTGPITRTALQSLRTAASGAGIPVLVTAGLAEATREAAGADPAVLLRALAPVDGPRPTRVLLIEDNRDIASAFAASLERRGMEVCHAVSENEAVVQASQTTPQIVVSDLLLLRRRRVGVVDWLRQAGLLPTTPIVVYTSVEIDRNNLRQLKANETVLFVAERSTRDDVQQRLVDILGKLSTAR